MHAAIPELLWIGHSGDGRSPKQLYDAEISAVVDLAYEEAPAVLPRDLVYCRYPLVDGPGNNGWLMRLAIESVEHLLQGGTRIIVCCSLGMSRSPAVAAAAISLYRQMSLDEALALLAESKPHDVSTAFWQEVVDAYQQIQASRT